DRRRPEPGGLMATPAQWVAGARPRTLPAALAPVLVGTGAAAALDGFCLGPMRLVGSGAATPRQVLVAAALSFLVAAVAGLALAALSSWWLIAVGAVCIAAAWTY